MKNFFLIAALSFLASACATSTFKSVENECRVAAYQKIPATTRTKKDAEDITVVTREHHCPPPDFGAHAPHGRPPPPCYPSWTASTETRINVEKVDLNEEAREAAIAECTQRLCLERYGTADCSP